MPELPINEWIVIFYPRTGAVRLCPSLDYATQTLSSKSAAQHIYKSPNDFRTRHDHHSLESFWVLLHKHVSWGFPKTAVGSLENYSQQPPDVGTEEFCKLFWNFIQDVGDRLVAPQQEVQRSKEHYELRLSKMKELIESEDYKKTYNNQARTVFETLYQENKQFLVEDEIRSLILGLVAARRLKTKQDPWVIFQYYRPQFIKDGFIVRGKASKDRG